MILIDVWEGSDPRQRALDYRDRWGIEGTILVDETGDYARQLGVRGVPTNVLVDSTGVVHAFGAGNPEELHMLVDELLLGDRRRAPAR